MSAYTHVIHGFDPVFDQNSNILILGSLPSVKSRQNNFYYGNPQNRFWKLIAHLVSAPVPISIEQKTSLLLSNRIALWDVISECDIIGSGDATIKNPLPTDLSKILDHCQIAQIYANGSAAAKYFNKLQKPICRRDIITLPSTSPANAAWNFDRLCSSWSRILSSN
jgi:hypoxanthine-DNA glycosylase